MSIERKGFLNLSENNEPRWVQVRVTKEHEDGTIVVQEVNGFNIWILKKETQLEKFVESLQSLI